MAWNQNGGGWKGGTGGGPWGQGPVGGGGGGNGGGPSPDIEEILRRSQDKLRQAMPGGIGMFGMFAILLVAAAVFGYLFFTVRVNPDEVAVSHRRSHRHSLHPAEPRRSGL
jgi:modulator of FtsH protease HflK